MNQVLSATWQTDDQRVIAFGDIGVDYVLVGTLFTHAPRQLLLSNLTDADLQISIRPPYDVADNFPMAAQSSMIIDITANKSSKNGLFCPIGYGVFCKTNRSTYRKIILCFFILCS